MEFSRVGKHTLKCLISEQEILDMGYTLDDIMSNGARTQEFMNYIFDLAEQKFDMKFDKGFKTVRADFMSDHTLALTFTEQNNTAGMVEHLKDLVNGLIQNIEKSKVEKEEDQFSLPEGVKIDVMLLFSDLDTITRFAKVAVLENMPRNALYKFEDTFFLFMDLSESSEEEVKRLSVIVDEYAQDIIVGAQKRAFVQEHGQVILKERAMEQLKEL